MFDDYQIPSVALIAALMLAFGYLHLRFRSVRTLLWILSLACAGLQGVLLWIVAHRVPLLGGIGSPQSIWLNAAGESALLLSTGLFLASLSPLSFAIGRIRILYVIPYLIPLLSYSILYYGIGPTLLAGSAPLSGVTSGPMLGVYAFLALWAAAVAFVWSLQKGAIPIWLAAAIVTIGGGLCVPSLAHGNILWPLLVVESGNLLMTALLVIYNYRRLSPGVFLSVGGFVVWALIPLRSVHAVLTPSLPWLARLDILQSPSIAAFLIRAIVLSKVVVAVGLILLVLEEEVQNNQLGRERERRVRIELEAYSRQALTARSLEEFDRVSSQLCTMIVEHSCFSGSAMLVRSAGGGYTLVGYAGMDGATAGALDAVTRRMPANAFTNCHETLADGSATCSLDFNPWLTPGDDLERLRLTRVGAVPMLGTDNAAEGALLLTGLRIPLETLRADDLLPLEILAGRLQAARAQAMMLGKLIESERFAGVGQLATNVAQQLNNPLTVILGYSALLEDAGLPGVEQRGAEAITIEARRMKQILERLSSFSRLSADRFNTFSIADLMADIEQVLRTDFLRNSIEFRLSVAPGLMPIFGNPHQIRQALLHATQYAIDSVLRVSPNQEKSVRIEVAQEDSRVHIAITHSGPGFAQPERAFDTLSSGISTNEATGIGLSLCAAIIREHRGVITATNLTPTGATIQIDLPIS